MKRKAQYSICPHCGNENEPDTAVCPGCGYEWMDSNNDDSKETTTSTPKVWVRYVLAIVAALLVSALLIIGLPWGSYLVPVWLGIVIAIMIYTRPHAEKMHSAEKKLFHELVNMLGGDRELAERLIDHEKKRRPDFNRLQHIDNAMYHLKRDRR